MKEKETLLLSVLLISLGICSQAILRSDFWLIFCLLFLSFWRTESSIYSFFIFRNTFQQFFPLFDVFLSKLHMLKNDIMKGSACRLGAWHHGLCAQRPLWPALQA